MKLSIDDNNNFQADAAENADGSAENKNIDLLKNAFILLSTAAVGAIAKNLVRFTALNFGFDTLLISGIVFVLVFFAIKYAIKNHEENKIVKKILQSNDSKIVESTYTTPVTPNMPYNKSAPDNNTQKSTILKIAIVVLIAVNFVLVALVAYNFGYSKGESAATAEAEEKIQELETEIEEIQIEAKAAKAKGKKSDNAKSSEKTITPEQFVEKSNEINSFAKAVAKEGLSSPNKYIQEISQGIIDTYLNGVPDYTPDTSDETEPEEYDTP